LVKVPDFLYMFPTTLLFGDPLCLTFLLTTLVWFESTTSTPPPLLLCPPSALTSSCRKSYLVTFRPRTFVFAAFGFSVELDIIPHPPFPVLSLQQGPDNSLRTFPNQIFLPLNPSPAPQPRRDRYRPLCHPIPMVGPAAAPPKHLPARLVQANSASSLPEFPPCPIPFLHEIPPQFAVSTSHALSFHSPFTLTDNGFLIPYRST